MEIATLLAFLSALSAASARAALRIESAVNTVTNDLVNVVNYSLANLPEVMYFPDDEGNPQPANVKGTTFRVPGVEQADVFFKLYTRNGPTDGEIIVPGDGNSLKNSSFNASQPTYIITHGFIQGIQSNTIQTMKDMYVAYRGGNVIAVDWSKISKNVNYFIVKQQTVQVGQFVGAFTAFLVNEAGVDVSNVHLTGHSLGAHVVGIAGKNIKIILGKKAGRITGLDPAGPLFSVLDKRHRLDRSDADFVDVIHTCGGWLGMQASIGHVDFYPSGGTMVQPGCSLDLALAGTCSHSRSWEFFAESINSHLFSARACSSYLEYQQGNCIDSPKVPMGQHTPKNISGNYYLNTAEIAPFALG